MATLSSSRQFWDEKAGENPYWYVSSFVNYDNPDLDAFWASGARIWDELKASTGYAPRPSDTVVEIGCGVGRLTRALAREVGEVEAFDISPAMIDRAREGAPGNVHFHPTGGESLEPLAPDSADLVLAYLVFQHLPNLAAFSRCLHEMVRIAKPGGTVAFTTSPRTWRVYLLSALRAKAYLAGRFGNGGPSGLHRCEWTGIRPSVQATRRRCPIALQMAVLPGGRWLFFGTKPDRGSLEAR